MEKMLKTILSWLFGNKAKALQSPQGSVHKVCPKCRRPNPIVVRTCQCGYEFPAGSTALPEYASAQELLEHAARQGLDASVSVKQRAPSESSTAATTLSTKTTNQEQLAIGDVNALAATTSLDIKVSVKPSSDRPIRRPRKPKVILPATVTGRLTHKKIFLFRTANWSETTTACHICHDQHWVFSISVDSAGIQHQCCLRCLYKLGGQEQIDLAMLSAYAAEVWNCIQALDQLRAEFPDPSRRPYGEKTLINAIEGIDITHPENTERILHKIRVRGWTEYDLARIEGRPEPPSKY
jgi:hypothetical protein